MAEVLESNSIWVLKVGGSLLQCEMGMGRLMESVAQIIHSGQKLIMIHGGGCLVEEQLSANGMKTVKLDGLRVTPAEQMPIVAGALAGTSNKILQGMAKLAGITSVGLSLGDANMVTAKIKDPSLGMVGEVEPDDSCYLDFILSQGWMPIISSIALNSEGQLLNVNADQAATAIALLMDAKLIMLSDVSGVLDGKGNLIASLDARQIEELIHQGVIDTGMKVKVEAALEVANKLGQGVQVASWRDPKQLVALSRGQAIGTQILPNLTVADDGKQ